MFKIIHSFIPGCFTIEFRQMQDTRGSFTKTFHEDLFSGLNLSLPVNEEYFSFSAANVFRGLHFQVPPRAIDKTIFCVSGQVTDYVVDLRKGSPTFGKHASFELDSMVPKAVFVPQGLAHGFLVRSEKAVMQCKSSGVYDAASDVTISYLSFPFAGEVKDPVISERDLNAMRFESFDNPFTYD